MTREFSSLTPQEALHVAIFIEERNAELYEQFAELFAEFKDPDSLDIAQVFWDMSEEERRHGTLLQDRYFERYATQACVVTDDDIREMIELPRLEQSDIFAVARSKGAVSPRRMALQVALQAEQLAMRYYAQLVEKTADTALRHQYSELANFEADHTEFLQRKLDEATRAVGGSEVA
jgi:erythrin-vacuolar iron transport family protein